MVIKIPKEKGYNKNAIFEGPKTNALFGKRKILLSDYKPGKSRDRQARKRLKSKQKADRRYGV